MADPIIPRKWTLRAHDQQNTFSKGLNESSRHVIMKAMIWALYLPEYPTMSIEIRIGDRYKPDLVAYAEEPNIFEEVEKPLFWGESGVVSFDKIRSITRRFPDTHFVIAKWSSSLTSHRQVIEKARATAYHRAPFDLLSIPADAIQQFISDDGEIHISFDDIEWIRLPPLTD